MAETHPNKRLREQFNCEICPAYGLLPLIMKCSECNENLLISCPHDRLYDSRYICQNCSRLSPTLTKQLTTCVIHGKNMTYYCLNCECGICVYCLRRSSDHNKHSFEQLEKLFLKRMQDVERKFEDLSEALKRRDEYNKRVVRNLQMITANEMELIAQVDALVKSAKSEIQWSVRVRKDTLMAKLKQPDVGNLNQQDLKTKLSRMSKTEFLQKYAEILESISQQIPSANEFHELVECHNIKCSLIPKLIMQPVFIENITNKKSPVSFILLDASGFAWSLRVFFEQKLEMQFTPKNKRQEIYKHKAVVEILHNDFMKTINHSFFIERYDQRRKFTDMNFLRKNGFISTDGHDMLMIRVAIKPESIVVENYLHIDENNKFRHGDNEEINELKNMISQLKLCSSSNFFLSLANLANEGDLCVSQSLVDSRGTEWCLQLTRNVQERHGEKKACLGAHIVRLGGCKSKCKFYVKLYNNDPEKSIVMEEDKMLEWEDCTYGQNSIVDVDLLTEGYGFLNAGLVRFEFGITPVITPSTDKSKTTTVSNNGTSEDFLRYRHLFGTFG